MIVFYVSGHGFGHASRDIEVINALLALQPDLDIVVRTTVPKWLVTLTVRGHVRYEPVDCDTGIAQVDSLRIDEGETVRRLAAFMAGFAAHQAAEAQWLREQHAELVVADVPALGVAAAAAAGIPAVALGNFTWDWIYAAYPGTDAAVDQIRSAYAHAHLALRLPLCGGFAAFSQVVDVPFVARHSRRDPQETRAALGLDRDARAVLVSFGGYGVAGIDLNTLATLEGYTVLVSTNVPLGSTSRPLSETRPYGSLIPVDESALYASGFRYEDLVRAVDVVVTKPGYGIVAECLANRTALLYTSRGHFVEYDVIVEAMPRFLRAGFINQDDLFAGQWSSHLDALLAHPAPAERPPTDGAGVVAERILAARATS